MVYVIFAIVIFLSTLLDKYFFQKTRILDGGMGQELLNRGVKPHGTLWGASALYIRKLKQLSKLI